eukprot:g43272.t1
MPIILTGEHLLRSSKRLSLVDLTTISVLSTLRLQLQLHAAAQPKAVLPTLSARTASSATALGIQSTASDGSWTRGSLDANSICAFVGQATCSCTAKDQLARTVCKFSGSWNKDSLSASSLCGFVGQATCSCTAKDQLRDWSWNKDSLSASSLCGFVGQATCSCTAKDQLSAYTCTDGSGGFCQAPSVCKFSGGWNQDSLSASSHCGFVGQATCSCSARWTTASYICTDGTVGSCGTGSVCKFAASWNKDSLSPGALCA